MRYLGGKHVAGKYIVPILLDAGGPRTKYWDAMCGGLHIARRLAAAGRRVRCTDAHAPLIAMYKAIAEGWVPPDKVTKRDYDAAKLLSDSDPMKAFVGFGCAFGGVWFHSYAWDNSGRNYAAEARRGLLRDVRTIIDAGGCFARCDVTRTKPRALRNTVIYFDPPYRGVSGYAVKIDHAKFDDVVCAWAQSNTVFVSEYDLPYGAIVWERRQKSTVSRDKSVKMHTERLYRIDRPR